MISDYGGIGLSSRRAKLLISAAVVLTLSTGCSGGSKTVSVVEPTTSAVLPESVVFDWQDVYEKKLNDFKSSAGYLSGAAGTMFDLYDLTGDGSPELIISPSMESESECRIYTCISGNAVEIGECGVKGAFEFVPSTKTVCKKYIGKTFEITEFLAIEENSLVSKKKFYNNSSAASTGARLTYEVDNETVNVAEYEKQLGEFIDTGLIGLGRKYSLTDQGVKYALHYSESWGAVLTETQKELFTNVLKERMNGADSTAAFEICDLNGDDVPELIFSEGSYPGAFCHIYKLNENLTEEIASPVDSMNGNMFFDVEKKVFFGSESGGAGPMSLDSGAVSGYTRSDNVMECGRKYLLNEDSLVKAFR